MHEKALYLVLRVLRSARAAIHPTDVRPEVGRLVAEAARAVVKGLVPGDPVWTAESLEAAACAALAHSGWVPDSGSDPKTDVACYGMGLKARGARRWLVETIGGIEGAMYALDLLMDEEGGTAP